MKKDQTLSEAFLAVRPFLWDGIEKRNGKNVCICNATISACNEKAISMAHAQDIKNIVMDGIHPYCTINSYVFAKHGAEKMSDKNLQQYRHAWLIELSNEFAKQS